MNKKRSQLRLSVSLTCLISLFVFSSLAEAASPAPHISGKCEASILASGFEGPDGLAIHPDTEDIYVSEKDAGRISLITASGQKQTVIEADWSVHEVIEAWAISKTRTREFILNPKLVKPGAITFTKEGHLLVAEERPWGRILEFIPNAEGKYDVAKFIPVPWLDKRMAWDDIAVSEDGRLFVVGYDPEGEGLLHYGSVLMRDVEMNWWVVDYGPFSKFSSLTLSRDEEIAVVCERSKGEIISWDTVRQLPMGTAQSTVFGAEVENNCLLRDGAFIIARVPGGNETGKSTLVRIDSQTQQAVDVATGFDRIGSVILNEKTGSLYTSDYAKGQVLEIVPNKNILSPGYLLRRPLRDFGTSESLTPRVAPAFINQFLASIGAEQTEDSKVHGEVKGEQKDVAFSSTFSLKEFASKIPMVAGKVTTIPMQGDPFENPVVSLEFLLFFPANVLRSTEAATPSLSFFTAKRKNGDIERSRILLDTASASQKIGDDWIQNSQEARIYLPLASCGLTKHEDGLDVNIAFLGLSIYDDFILQLTTGKENKGTLIVEDKMGDEKKKVEYKLTLVDKAFEGTEPVPNLMITGFDPATKSQDLGWLSIGKWPVEAALAVEQRELTVFAALDEEVTEIIMEKEMKRRVDLGGKDGPGDGAEAVESVPGGGN